MIEKIYVDMDGVICNFERRYFELYGELPGSMRDRKEFSSHWDNFIETRQFESLDWWPGGKELILFLEEETDVPYEILTSSGGNKHHDKVEKQKQVWLKNNGLSHVKPNVVAGRKNKALYATPNTILIDDTADVIDAFNKANGIGILHKEIGNTLMMLRKLLT